jgi:hypothetical protein
MKLGFILFKKKVSDMKNYILGSALLLVIFAFKCERLPSYNLNESFEMHVGSKLVNTKIITAIRLDKIVEDSRCPKNTNCFWAGQVKVKFTFVNESKLEQEFVLTLRDDRPEESKVIVNGFSYELLTVDPYPEAEKKIETADYVVSLEVKEVERK